jgi:hypothetical protein
MKNTWKQSNHCPQKMTLRPKDKPVNNSIWPISNRGRTITNNLTPKLTQEDIDFKRAEI